MKQDLSLIVDKVNQINMEDLSSEEYCTVRHFSVSGRKVVNRGDSFKIKRPINRSDSFKIKMPANQGDCFKVERSPSGYSIASLESSSYGAESSPPSLTPPPKVPPNSVAVLGASSVGKSSLVSQFMTSDFLQAYENYNCDRSHNTVSVLLNGEESDLTFTDLSYSALRDMVSSEYDAFLVVYSVTDRRSFNEAELILSQLEEDGFLDWRAVILVANKVDLARCRLVTEQEGRLLATASNCKYIESSVVINHQVDELLVGIVNQIRLRSGVFADPSPQSRKRGGKYRRSKTSSSFRGLLNKLRLTKSKSCHKLHVLS